MIKMTYEQFVLHLEQSGPPSSLDDCLQALWYDAKGDWSLAHDLINNVSSARAAKIHAYLHRKEGDLWNARYWYQRAEATMPEFTLQEEWQNLVRENIDTG